MNIQSSSKGIYYRTLGSGKKSIVYVHGFCENMSLWDNVLSEIPGYGQIMLDLPGFGLSNGLTFSSLKNMAEIVVEFLQENDISNPILVGHSMGGYLSLEILKNNLMPVRALAMIHSTFEEDSPEKKANRDKTIEFLEHNPLSAYLKVFVEGLFAPENAKNPILIEKANQIVSQNNSANVQAGLKAMRNRQGSLEWLRGTEIPVYIVCGQYDTHVPLMRSLHAASLCKTGMFSLLENSGHLGLLEEPEKIKKGIGEFTEWVDELDPEPL